MIAANEIVSANWQLSTGGFGDVLQGIDDIGQSVIAIVTTQKGSDPLRPQFGCDAWQYVDRPANIAIPNIKREIIEAVNLWEPRLELTDVSHTYDAAGLAFQIGWQLVEGSETGTVSLPIGDFAGSASVSSSPAFTTFINPKLAAQIKSQNWQLANDGSGRIVQGVQDIGQAILFTVSTRKGSDPLRPGFGCDIFDHIDKALPIAGPNMVKAIRQAVDLFEPRVELLGVDYYWQDDKAETERYPAGIRFDIGWRLRGGDVKGNTSLLLGLYDSVLNDVLNPPITDVTFYILATENGEPILTETGQQILV